MIKRKNYNIFPYVCNNKSKISNFWQSDFVYLVTQKKIQPTSIAAIADLSLFIALLLSPCPVYCCCCALLTVNCLAHIYTCNRLLCFISVCIKLLIIRYHRFHIPVLYTSILLPYKTEKGRNIIAHNVKYNSSYLNLIFFISYN